MYDFEVNEAIIEIIENSYNQEKIVKVINFVSQMLIKENINITDYRWQSLVNHVAAMVNRSFSGELLNGIEQEMFADVSEKSLNIALQIVKEIGNLPQNEQYLLSIHFETAEID